MVVGCHIRLPRTTSGTAYGNLSAQPGRAVLDSALDCVWANRYGWVLRHASTYVSPTVQGIRTPRPWIQWAAPDLYLDLPLKTLWVEGDGFQGGRPWLRRGPIQSGSKAWRVDRPPSHFSQAEENRRPCEPACSNSVGEGDGPGSRNLSLTQGGSDEQA